MQPGDATTGMAGMSQERGPRDAEGGGKAGFMRRWRAASGDRPTFVYIVIGVVAVTLTVLLAIIYFSASERERLSPPICTDITLAAAKQAVLRGDVERLTIVYDEAPYPPGSERYGPVLAKLDYTDATCSNLPQGVINQDVVYTISGVIAFYNQNTEGQQAEIIYQTSDQLGEELFVLPTEVPTQAPTPDPTATVTVPPTTTPVLVSPATPAPLATPERTASPAASPAVTP